MLPNRDELGTTATNPFTLWSDNSKTTTARRPTAFFAVGFIQKYQHGAAFAFQSTPT